MVTDLWRVSAKIDTPRLHSVHWQSTTRIVALTPPLIPQHQIKILRTLVQ